MKNNTPSQIMMGHLDWSVRHLADSLTRPATEYYQNAALQRLSFTFNLVIKTISTYASEQGNTLSSAGESLRYAHECQWIEELSAWEHMSTNINILNDLETQTPTQKIYAELPKNKEMFETIFKRMQETILPAGKS